MSSQSSSSLMPNHSIDMAAELSAHLNSALSSDLSYSQMNDAKLRGLSSMVGWEQFHGMVLTAHLQPVNLRNEPIDEIAKGVARNKKIEQQKERATQQYIVHQLVEGSTNPITEAEQKRNEEFALETDIRPPINAHEFARDWKAIGSKSGEAIDFIQTQRYRYLLAIPLNSAGLLLKGGIPLEMIGSIIQTIHSRWIQTQPKMNDSTIDATTSSDVEPSTPVTSSTPSSSSPSPYDLQHIAVFLHTLTTMSSFTISVFSLTKADKANMAAIVEYIEDRMKLPDFIEWEEANQKAIEARALATSDATSTGQSSAASSTSSTSATSSSSSSSSSSSYPMLLPGWPIAVGDSSLSGSLRSSSGPPRDEAAGNSKIVSNNTIGTTGIKKATANRLTHKLLEELRMRYKCA